MSYRTAAHEAIDRGHKRFGYIPDADHKRRQKDSTLLFGYSTMRFPVSAVPKQSSLVNFEAPLMDQGPFRSCTGHGTSQAVYTSAKAAGSPLPFVPSPWFTYALARILERTDAGQALTDSGAMPSDLLTVLRLYGAMDIRSPTSDGRYSDVDGSNVNTEPDLLDLEISGLRLLTGEYRVDETDPGFDSQICANLAGVAGNKPSAAGIGLFVDGAFENWNPASGPIVSIDLNDPLGGGHWLCLDYYYTTPGGVLVFGGPNSWGASWPATMGPPGSPYWTPGHYEITAPCLQRVLSDCLLFPVQVLS